MGSGSEPSRCDMCGDYHGIYSCAEHRRIAELNRRPDPVYVKSQEVSGMTVRVGDRVEVDQPGVDGRPGVRGTFTVRSIEASAYGGPTFYLEGPEFAIAQARGIRRVR